LNWANARRRPIPSERPKRHRGAALHIGKRHAKRSDEVYSSPVLWSSTAFQPRRSRASVEDANPCCRLEWGWGSFASRHVPRSRIDHTRDARSPIRLQPNPCSSSARVCWIFSRKPSLFVVHVFLLNTLAPHASASARICCVTACRPTHGLGYTQNSVRGCRRFGGCWLVRAGPPSLARSELWRGIFCIGCKKWSQLSGLDTAGSETGDKMPDLLAYSSLIDLTRTYTSISRLLTFLLTVWTACEGSRRPFLPF
jgi:hypothetical protein